MQRSLEDSEKGGNLPLEVGEDQHKERETVREETQTGQSVRRDTPVEEDTQRSESASRHRDTEMVWENWDWRDTRGWGTKEERTRERQICR